MSPLVLYGANTCTLRGENEKKAKSVGEWSLEKIYRAVNENCQRRLGQFKSYRRCLENQFVWVSVS